jgi:hypothetical protein
LEYVPHRTRAQRLGRTVAVTLIVLSASVLALGVFLANGKTDDGRRASEVAALAAARAAENTRIAVANTARTECIRGISGDLERARWALVGIAFKAARIQDRAVASEVTDNVGSALVNLPTPQEVADYGGQILNTTYRRCPPAPVNTKG